MEQYIYRPAHELARLIREGKATSADIVKEHLARIKERNGQLNAVVPVCSAWHLQRHELDELGDVMMPAVSERA